MTDSIRRNIKRKTSKINDVKLLQGFPLFSFVELNVNELCNRTCIFCPRHDPKLYPNQNLHMDIGLAEEIAKQLKEINYSGIVNISGTGEATLTRDLLSIVKKFGDRNIHIEMVTNGDKLKPNLIENLYNSGLKQFVVSMYDGPEQIEFFTNLFKQCGIGDNYFTLRDRWYEEEEDYGLMFTNRTGIMGAKIKSPHERPCYYTHYATYIDLNGDVLLCCQDMYNRTKVFGNILEKKLVDIWLDKKLNDYRNKLKKGKRVLSPCNNCTANGMIFGESHSKLW